MRLFLRSRRFKIAATVISVVLVVSIIIRIAGGIIAPGASVLGTIAAPFEQFASSVTRFFNDFNTRVNKSDELVRENEELQNEINRLTQELLDYENALQENEFYEDYLEIKEQHQDFKFEPALLTAYDADNEFYSFNINKGSLSGVAAYDPVISSQGLIGYVSQVAPSYAKVTTILSPTISVGGYDNRTGDAGILSGHLSLAGKKLTQLSKLSRSCSVAIGDYVVTSGGGVFPQGLLIGTVSALDASDTNNYLYATISPAVDFENISECMVITNFAGQGALLSDGTKEQ